MRQYDAELFPAGNSEDKSHFLLTDDQLAAWLAEAADRGENMDSYEGVVFARMIILADTIVSLRAQQRRSQEVTNTSSRPVLPPVMEPMGLPNVQAKRDALSQALRRDICAKCGHSQDQHSGPGLCASCANLDDNPLSPDCDGFEPMQEGEVFPDGCVGEHKAGTCSTWDRIAGA